MNVPETTLKDYRASHFLMNLIRAHLQGWFVFENILLQSLHPDGNSKVLKKLEPTIEVAKSWCHAIQSDTTPFMNENGAVNSPEIVGQIRNVLSELFQRIAGMDQRISGILDQSEPLESRTYDMLYLLACVGWVHYFIFHQVRGDLEFAERFADQELLDYRAGDLEAARKDVDFIEYSVNALRNDTTHISSDIAASLSSMADTLFNEAMRDQIHAIHNYLTILEQQNAAG